MSDKPDAWMPLWIGAYLADTMNLTTIQHGAYMLLLMAYWRDGAPLPDDDEELRSITKCDRAEWKRIRPVLARFFRVGAGVWWHKRVETEMVEANQRKAGATSKAKAGAKARWKNASKHATSNAPSMLQALPEQCPTPLPIDSVAVATAALPPRDATKAELWEAGKSLLVEGGVPAAQCGSFVGKLVKDYGEAVVVEAVRSAVKTTPADPREYLKATCQRLKGERVTPVTVPSIAPAATNGYLAELAAHTVAVEAARIQRKQAA